MLLKQISIWKSSNVNASVHCIRKVWLESFIPKRGKIGMHIDQHLVACMERNRSKRGMSVHTLKILCSLLCTNHKKLAFCAQISPRSTFVCKK